MIAVSLMLLVLPLQTEESSAPKRFAILFGLFRDAGTYSTQIEFDVLPHMAIAGGVGITDGKPGASIGIRGLLGKPAGTSLRFGSDIGYAYNVHHWLLVIDPVETGYIDGYEGVLSVLIGLRQEFSPGICLEAGFAVGVILSSEDGGVLNELCRRPYLAAGFRF